MPESKPNPSTPTEESWLICEDRLSRPSNPDALESLNRAVRSFNIYRGDPVAHVDQAISLAPDLSMAHLFKAYLFALATEPEATKEAATILKQTRALAKTELEQSHLEVLDSLVRNNWTEAGLKLDFHSMKFPHDLVGLQAGHLIDFYRANARNLRDRIARALPQWTEEMPGYSTLLGMYAFGLEESGQYADAELVGREAVAKDPLDAWAHHAVAHVLEMQGRPTDGLAWMNSREPHWSGDDNFFKVHNWWHKALYHLELGQNCEALALFDREVRKEPSAVALDLVDASALLWRMQLLGVEVGNRWEEVASAWEVHADGRLYPFNDWHAAMAYLGAGRDADVQVILDAYDSSEPSTGEARQWAVSAGKPLIEGFRSFWHGEYAKAAAILHRSRFITNTFGGSHAQRDIIDWTMVEAAARSGHSGMVEALSNERLASKPHSPINHRFRSSVTRTPKHPQPAAA